MRRPRTFLLLLAICGSEFRAQDRVVVDLTEPMGRDGIGFGGGFTRSIKSPLAVRILGFPDRSHTVGDSFTYEVEITNESKESILIPQSSDATGLVDARGMSPLRGGVSLRVDNEIDGDRQLAGALAYGDPTVPSSVFFLAPKQSFIIRAKGQMSIPGIMMREYLPRSKGRVRVRAVYSLQTGTSIAFTEPSPPRPFTLLLRDIQKPKR